jgi:hypothetical protein
MDLFEFLRDNFRDDFSPEVLMALPSKSPTSNDIDSVVFSGTEDVTFSTLRSQGQGDKVPLVKKPKANGDCTTALQEPDMGTVGGSFLAVTNMSHDDIRRILVVFLTRMVKSRDGLSVVNYSATLKAVDYLKYVLEIRKRLGREIWIRRWRWCRREQARRDDGGTADAGEDE